MAEREVSSGSSVHSSEEEYIGSSDDDEDFIVPAKYVRITTLAEIRAYRVRLPSVANSSEEVKLDPRLVSEHLVRFILPSYTSWLLKVGILISFFSIWGLIWSLSLNPVYL